MALQDHIVSLKHKHATIDNRIAQEEIRPHPDEAMLNELKRQKLKLKDEIAALERV